MSTLQRDLRGRLGEAFSVARPAIVTEQRSDDGTRKWLLRFADGQEVETVFIPEDDRGALCVSTQVGCTLTCTFCHTGTMPLVRNLGIAEIVAQMLVARDALAEWPTRPRRPPVHQHRRHGHGRAPVQLRQHGGRAAPGHGRARAQPVAAADHRLDLGRRAAYRAAGRGSRRRASRSRCTPCATSCATCWCRSIANGTSPRCSTRAAAIRRGGRSRSST